MGCTEDGGMLLPHGHIPENIGEYPPEQDATHCIYQYSGYKTRQWYDPEKETLFVQCVWIEVGPVEGTIYMRNIYQQYKHYPASFRHLYILSTVPSLLRR
jgi:hypothetical protein